MKKHRNMCTLAHTYTCTHTHTHSLSPPSLPIQVPIDIVMEEKGKRKMTQEKMYHTEIWGFLNKKTSQSPYHPNEDYQAINFTHGHIAFNQFLMLQFQIW